MLITKIRKHRQIIPLALFHLVVVLIVMVNFPFGRFFSGWDALHPEFNFKINFQRAIFASWQENYGLGAVGGHGFAATLPHIIVTFLLSLVLPLPAIRPTFTFLCFYLGGLGMYFLSRLILTEVCKEKLFTAFKNLGEFIALIAALFYLFNLGTVQTFFLQLEAYIIHFAALPWLFWILIKVLQKRTVKNLLLFFLIIFFSSTQSFIPPLFLVYIVALGIFLFIYVFDQKFSSASLRKSFLVIILTFLINAYWLLPFGHYALSQGKSNLVAYNNLVSTSKFIAKSKKYGDLKNVALLKGFFLESHELGGYTFGPWIDHFQNLQISLMGYAFFGFVLLGFVVGLFLIRNWLIKGFAGVSLLFFTGVAVDLEPFSLITKVLQSVSPAYMEAFRNTFTKFSTGVALSYSIFLSIGILIFLSLILKLLRERKIVNIAVGVFLIGLLLYTLPYFKGHFFYKRLALEIPKAYFEIFDFFKDKEDGKIADFPQDCAEGWFTYKWGYFGSGFKWYGICQPILARTFDVWSNYNENYYWEVVHALRERNYKKIDILLQKYEVEWVLFDPNLLHCKKKVFLYSEDFLNYLDESPNYSLVKIFTGEDILPIRIYRNNALNSKKFVSIKTSLPNVGPEYQWNDSDIAYLDLGDYLTERAKQLGVYYPFRSLFTGRQQEELEFEVEEKFNLFVFSKRILDRISDLELVTPSLSEEEAVFWTKELEEERQATPSVQIREGRIEVGVDRQEGYFSYDSLGSDDIFRAKLESCNPFNVGVMERKEVEEDGKKLLRSTSMGSSNCLGIDLPHLTQKIGYLVKVESRNLEGKSMLFYILNSTSKKTVLETYLPADSQLGVSYFIIPPMEEFGAGYSLHFDNISIGREKTVNDLGKVEVYPIPYRFLKEIKLISNVKTQDSKPQLETQNFDVYHPNPSFYKVTIGSGQGVEDNLTLVLSQAFNDGWVAFQVQNEKLKIKNFLNNAFPFIFGERLKEHVLVNNWANGWSLGELKTDNLPAGSQGLQQTTIYIFFWPQVLEFLGFGMLLGVGGWLIFKVKFGKLKRK